MQDDEESSENKLIDLIDYQNLNQVAENENM